MSDADLEDAGLSKMVHLTPNTYVDREGLAEWIRGFNPKPFRRIRGSIDALAYGDELVH